MISVTRMNGSRIYVNAELIQTVESTPDTIITLVNEKKLIVREKVDEVAHRMIEYQQKVHQPLSQETEK